MNLEDINARSASASRNHRLRLEGDHLSWPPRCMDENTARYAQNTETCTLGDALAGRFGCFPRPACRRGGQAGDDQDHGRQADHLRPSQSAPGNQAETGQGSLSGHDHRHRAVLSHRFLGAAPNNRLPSRDSSIPLVLCYSFMLDLSNSFISHITLLQTQSSRGFSEQQRNNRLYFSNTIFPDYIDSLNSSYVKLSGPEAGLKLQR